MLLCFSAQQELLPSSQIPGTRCFGFLLEAQMGLFKKEKGKREKKLQCETQLLPSWLCRALLFYTIWHTQKCSAGISSKLLI